MSSGRLRSFLQAMEKLACPSGPQRAATAQVKEISGNSIMWPHLTHLSTRIKGLDFFDFHGLAVITCRHKNGLGYVSLYDIVCADGEWCCLWRMWADLRAGTLAKIQMWPPGKDVDFSCGHENGQARAFSHGVATRGPYTDRY